MSKLVLFAHLKEPLQDKDSQFFACAFHDELHFSRRIGEPVIVANIHQDQQLGYLALATLEGFKTDSHGVTLAHLTDLRVFPDTVAFFETTPDIAGMAEISEDRYHRIIDSAVGGATFDEAVKPDDFDDLIKTFSTQLRRQQSGRCSFSDVFTEQGRAYIIRPLDHGGRWHVGNFVFLDPEPGELFVNFAWTLGPGLEILLNASVVAAGLAETLPPGGKLALRQANSVPLDMEAVAWHREQFIARFKKT